MSPRAVLRWPNGEASQGRLEVGTSGGLHFLVDGVHGPLARRCEKSDRLERRLVAPGPIPVSRVPAGAHQAPAHVEPALLRTVSGVRPEDLQVLAGAAGTLDHGVPIREKWRLSKVIQGALRHLEAACTDQVAVRRAREALERPFTLVKLAHMSPHAYLCSTVDVESGGEVDLAGRLAHLEDGAHLLLRVTQQGEHGGHALAISATRLSRAEVRVSVFNPSGWEDPHDAAIGKIMRLEDACEALTALRHSVVSLPVEMRGEADEAWRDPWVGMPLATWLGAAGTTPDWNPSAQRMTPQKHSDCSIEVEFAWLASVLPEADYKLAKANVLSTFLHASTPNDGDGQVQQRLRERVTSSLSGYAMAAAVNGGHSPRPLGSDDPSG
ncbi:hypothetical protein [Hydrogenophaga soli]